MSSGGGNTVLDDTFEALNDFRKVATLGLFNDEFDDISKASTKAWQDVTGETQRRAEQESKDAAKKQREYELKELEKQKKNQAAIQDATRQRDSRRQTQAMRRNQGPSLALGNVGEGAGAQAKNLLGL